jgi:hypothetical protein
VILIWKRLEGAKFKWPAISDGVMRLPAAQLAALFRSCILMPLLLTLTLRQIDPRDGAGA